MKRKDLKGLFTKSSAELEGVLADLEKQTSSLSMQLESRKLKNTNAAKNLKRSIAQVKTIINQNKLDSKMKVTK